ncbi:hypothetical protein JCM12298_03930 [Desulfothermus naphthae]
MSILTFFIVGTGRCGTNLFSKLFSNEEESICEHEAVFRHESMLRFWKYRDDSYYLQDIKTLFSKIDFYSKKKMIYGISSAFASFVIPLAYRIFKEKIKFILLVREPSEFVRSALARGFFDPSHPNPCLNQLLPNKEEEIYTRWSKITPFEKNLWYWKTINNYVIEEFQKISVSQYKIIKLENLNLTIVKRLYSFLGLRNFNEQRIKTLLSIKINASPENSKKENKENINPYSSPKTFPSIEYWKSHQLLLLKKYTKNLLHIINQKMEK